MMINRSWWAAGAAALALLTCPGVATAAPAIAWHGCSSGPDDEVGAALDAAGARCGEITVPVDYSHPRGATIAIAVARRAATDPAHRLGTLVVDIGGPEASRSGVNVLLDGSPAVAARYDLVGFDPRFLGRSAPLECGWPTGLAFQSSQVAAPDRAAFTRSTAVAADLAARCADRRDVLPHASTRNIARDMDVVRAALGERRISYLGWSYGSYLGAVYQQMFPDRTDRVVLDSAASPDASGPALPRETAPATAAALADWSRWAAGRDSEYGLGDTPEEVMGAVATITGAASLQVGTHRVDAAMVAGLLLTATDTDESYAELSARVRLLHDAARGVVVTPTPDQDAVLAFYTSTEVDPAFAFSAGTAIRCADRAASRDPETYFRDIQAHRAGEPLYGPLFRTITPCAFWPTAPAEPPTRIAGNRPVLMVGASGDPVTPAAGQQVLHRALTGSRMVTVDGAFRHGVYLSEGMSCADAVVNRYLLDGVLPAADVTCRS